MTTVAGLMDAYPLSALQAGMLFHSELQADTATYHDLFTLTLRGHCDIAALTAATDEVVARHPVLRTSFNVSDFSEPLQLVSQTARPALTEADLSALSHGQARQALLTWREEEKHVAFDWTVAPLLRLFVHRLPAGQFALTLSFHHAILDGWSVATLTTELLRRYAAQLAGTPEPVLALPVTYRDFVVAERALVAAPESASFWRAAMADAPVTRLTRQPGFPAGEGEDTETIQAPVPGQVTTALAQVARELHVPLRTVLLAAHLRVLGLISGEIDVTTGLVTHGRPEHEAGEQVLGLFLNAVPLRVRIDRPSWAELISAVLRAEGELLKYRAYPLFEIQRVAERSPLFEALFDYRDFHVYGELGGDGPIEIVTQDFFEQTNLPFGAAFSRSQADGSLNLTLTYNKHQFPPDQVEKSREHYLRALAAIGADRDADPREVGTFLAGDAVRVAGWNSTGTSFPGPATVPELVAAQASATPDLPALITPAGTMDYAAFTTGVNQLAHHLIAAGTRPDDVIAVLADRGPAMVTAIHAIGAAGAAYLPLDPEYPPARLAYMCADARARLLLTTRAHATTAGLTRGSRESPPWPSTATLPVIETDTDAPLITTRPATTPDRPIHPDQLAYVIYTSGSTGRPKGAAITHRALANRLHWMQHTFPLTPDDRVAHKTPFSFDVSVWELFWPLTTGAAMIIADPGGHRDTGYLTRLFTTTATTTAHFVPSMLEAFLDEDHPTAPLATRLPRLRQIFASGEPLPPHLATRFHHHLPATSLHNLYGPTETTIDVTWHHCHPGDNPLPIGTPIANTQARTINPAGQQTPIGVPGELVISGTQLARGYLHHPAQTARAFTPDPDGPPGTRRYHTGDLARWLPGGHLDYLGRLDHQIKIRGMRVEPGEIENTLTTTPGIKTAIVTTTTDHTGTHLTAYLIPEDPDNPPDPDTITTHLATTLPPHMIPATYQTLHHIPTTPNGKLDKTALPKPTIRRAGYEPPRDQVEARLASIWEKLLGLPAIGITDDFFALGGHSLLALRLAVRIRQELGRELPVATVLTAPTIRQLATELRRPDDMGSASPVVPLRTTGDRPALFLSHALGGQVFRYRPLAARLGDDQPVYTIPARGLVPGQDPHESLDEMADDYVSYIRSVRPHGPYVLGGFCIGGNIALEVARRLRAAGESVPVVFPVWSSADEPVVRSSLNDETMLMIHALAGGVNILQTVDLDELRELSTEERLVAVINASAREERLRPDTVDTEQARRYVRVFKANANAVGYHKHEPYDGNVVLLQPTDDPEITPGDDFGWRSVVTGNFAIAPLPGTRFTCVYEPLVAEMAAQIRRWMDHGFPADSNASR